MSMLLAIVGYGWIAFCLAMFLVHAVLTACRRDAAEIRARRVHSPKSPLIEAVRIGHVDRYA